MSRQGIQMTLIGEEQLKKLLDGIPKKQATVALRKGVRAGAKIITRTAKRFAPKRSGALRRAIRTRAMKRKRNRIGAITIIGEGNFKGDEFYGAFQEFGWKAGKANTPIEGKHFMERAAKAKGRSAGVVATAAIKTSLAASIPKVG